MAGGESLGNLYFDLGLDDKTFEAVFNATMKKYDNKFNIKYDISNIDPKDRNKQIRWDPVEGKMCFCRIDEILSDGIFLDVVPVNAVEYYEDRFIFLTVDPIFNINGDFSNATYLEIKGEIIFPSNYEISNMINRMYMNLTNIISKLESKKVK